MAIFKNLETGEEIEINEFYTSYRNGETIYKDRNRKQICDLNGKPLFLVPKDKPIDDIPSIVSFDNSSSAKKQDILRKRSREDYKKNGEENKRAMQGNALNQLKKIVSK